MFDPTGLLVGLIALAVLIIMQFGIDKKNKSFENKGGMPMKNNNENKVLFGLAGMKTAWAILTSMTASNAMST
jgi:hypothetical protein